MFMEGLRQDPALVEALSKEGLVIQAIEGKKVTVDYWKHNQERVRQTLASISRQLGIQIDFDLRARG
ncbi:MAG: hypothetical protein PeribacterA2_0855 [Candidatus Peribacter riflensis]|uniref:Uncharacterized protein n=1 Tax=Candidatus Peribacter riflensis TaxID=1735162 RepID=A0A0S1SKX2_9BACT|nr:MAG: hypothetical protein PeribacterA2_0855 [Candidatus Peribacter riflensis]OGJ79680.1 MAG: hypothetical protein A2412_01880 [Candidatus Peribacteria bacterium RIFOXYC1_FULL_58_8]ALM11321.1 MAG: hypothetical protein PeribacterB2_0857 [Candidatus Peribacter riflensis]ALM12423.1 MAG: hypothetical protein PeribacterC2_0856 [Candidatus Peribacter riflensis]ALM13524.1 MAG: hypothetical protein PeribacterD1_0855 [Candidatus Peribacter riflensis]